MTRQPKIIVLTGAESTGKSTLAEKLAKSLGVPFVPEIARDYIEKLNRKYTYEDVEEIAKIQVRQLEEMKKSDSQFLILDTWLIITKIWFEIVFNRKPGWLDDIIRGTKIDLFLVCDIDIPWIPDPVRENGGEKRVALHNKYIETIKAFGFPHKIVSGNHRQRFQNALNYIHELNG